MPWLESDPVDQRSRSIDAYLAGGFTVTELCARFQVSRRVRKRTASIKNLDGRLNVAARQPSPSTGP